MHCKAKSREPAHQGVVGPLRDVAPTLLLRLALLAAMFASAVLVVDYEKAGAPGFCGVRSGCTAVRLSVYSEIAGAPLPLIGLCAYAGLFVIALVARKTTHTLFVAAAAAAGGVIALVLIYLQTTKIGAFCHWCLMADVSSAVGAVAAGLVHRQASRSEAGNAWLAARSRYRGEIAAWAVGAAITVGLPFVWGEYPPAPPLPPGVAALAVTGKGTIVSFTDFECPFCRRLHPVLNELQRRWGDRVAVVRKMAPLPWHPGAMPAALAYLCTPEARREEMAHELYTTAAEMLTREGTLGIADKLKVDGTAFSRCLDDPATREAVANDLALFQSLGAQILPKTYIGPRLVIGFNAETARTMNRLVMQAARPGLPVSWLYAAIGFVAVLLTVVTLRTASAGRHA